MYFNINFLLKYRNSLNRFLSVCRSNLNPQWLSLTPESSRTWFTPSAVSNSPFYISSALRWGLLFWFFKTGVQGNEIRDSIVNNDPILSPIISFQFSSSKLNPRFYSAGRINKTSSVLAVDIQCHLLQAGML